MKRSVLVTAFSAMLSALGAVSGPDHKVKSRRREFRTESATRRACARCGLNSNAATVSQAADPATQAGHHRAQSARTTAAQANVRTSRRRCAASVEM